MAAAYKIHASLNSSGDWYWEVITRERKVVARGLAETHAEAVAAAEIAASQDRELQAFQSDHSD